MTFVRITAVLLCALLLGACGDDSGTPLSIAAEDTPTTSMSTSSTSTSSTSSPLTSVTVNPPPVETTGPSPTKAPKPPATIPVETTPPDAEHLPVDAPTDFTLEVENTYSECGVVESPCWGVRASWLGGEWWYQLRTNPSLPRRATVPQSVMPFTKDDDGRYWTSFLLSQGQPACVVVQAYRPRPEGGSWGDLDRSGPVETCMAVPSIE